MMGRKLLKLRTICLDMDLHFINPGNTICGNADILFREMPTSNHQGLHHIGLLIEEYVTELLAPLVRKPEDRLAVVVNYDNFSILPGLVDEYSTMVTRLTDRFYSRVTRYGTGGFLKARLDGRPSI